MEAGYTRTLIAVAVRHFPEVAADQVPWPDWGRVKIPMPYEVDNWLRGLPDWEQGDMNYLLYIVPPEEYKPLTELKIRGVKELDALEFHATEGQVAAARGAFDDQA